jgi:hypothetical protein
MKTGVIGEVHEHATAHTGAGKIEQLKSLRQLPG